ncbi:hypothetical protein A3709_10525 [Halioglobus sp. HI00S01]|uniref:hypothetical protein n=1 Tax=Halioglobus sp. HI00S01 TaxID=1822214 RepID=UPI0007C2BF88|nr:hypothetical protein [Halioglobus sp. HI00S01]KZX51255.1 hypothetical protein A3709_10525 [Halioglobus sp. HI00S01]
MAHALMGAAFVVAGWLFLSGGRPVARMRKAFGLALLLVLLEEGSQALIPNRSFSLSDLAMGVVGAATIYLFGCFIMGKLPSA